MTFYNRVKASKIAPIGTIIPWTGGTGRGTRAEDVPKGWIICSLSNAVLNAADYPLLAATVGNQYGPFPEAGSNFEIGVNYGLVNDFPYNKDPALGHVDQFGLPNLNQLSLIDIEGSRIPATDLLHIGQYIGRNGPDAVQPPTLLSSDVNITFTMEPSSSLAGRITGITMDDPIYFDTVYTVPRKLGVEHTPEHNHRPASDSDFDQFWSATPSGLGIMEFLPGSGLKDSSPNYVAISPIGHRDNESTAHRFRPGEKDITWYNENDGGMTMVDGSVRQFVDAGLELVPAIPDTARTIDQRSYINFRTWTASPANSQLTYQEDNRAMENIQTQSHTGAFPPAGYYNNRRNYYSSTDTPEYHRGSAMPATNIDDVSYDAAGGEPQPINTAVTDTYNTTLNHNAEMWADDQLRSHNHDAMEVTMGRGSLSIPSTILVNDISTGTTAPLSVDTALSVQINNNTPSLTMLYIIRAF
mgnify:CR=1 FL=1|tara:strand:+ start:6208 stop:7617 length:1410 start_codon:yes stop_codon:yes gene_type:complete